MPEPTAAELAKEAEQEAAVFAQAVNVEKLLNMLRAMDPAKDNLADNEEIQVCVLLFFVFLLPPFPFVFYLLFCYWSAWLIEGNVTGTVQGKHGATTQDREAYRQV